MLNLERLKQTIFPIEKICNVKLRYDERLLHVVAFSKKLHWSAQTKVITLKTQLHAVNAR
jgi:hypothetical protein